jgi:hypothetical protein
MAEKAEKRTENPEEFVRRILRDVFHQHADEDTVREVAEKISEVTGVVSSQKAA